MASSKPLPLPSRFLNQIETRTQKQITLTNKLAEALSQLNFKRIRQKYTQQNTQQFKFIHDFFFICVCGIPPFDHQYQALDLPAQKIVISLNGLKGKHTEQEYLRIYKTSGFQEQANKIRTIVVQKSEQGKNIVILYHSFGTFSVVNYVRMFKTDLRIKGLIDVAGFNIRINQLLIPFLKQFHSVTPKFLLQNSEQVHQFAMNDPIRKKAGFMAFGNKYQTIIHFKLGCQKSFETMFEDIRHLPKVLKLFLYGSKDRIIPEHLENQKAVFYSYVNRLEPQYEDKVKQAYKKYYGSQCNNPQQRFIFRFQGGQHSLHMQNKFREDMKTAIRQYLQILDLSL